MRTKSASELTSLNSEEQNEEWKKNTKKVSVVQSLVQHIHILQWVTSYNQEKALADLIAGITLGMTLIPQSIAYASLAGLSAQYGLYSSFVGPFIYVFFGTIPQVSIGPTSLMAILTLQYTLNLSVDFVIMLTFISGLVEFALGVFNFGFIINFISYPVTSAFTTATAAIVILKQLFNMTGLDTELKTYEIQYILSHVSFGDSLLGIICLGALLGLRLLTRIHIAKTTSFRILINRILWYISISRNAIVVVCSSLFAYTLVEKYGYNNIPFALNKEMNSIQPSVKFPPFKIFFQNTTYFFPDICNQLGGGIIIVPIISILANVAIAKSFVKDATVDASQEMFTLGLCNIVGSFFGGMPTCGAFTRSAVSDASGVKTPMSGIYTGGIVLLALSIMTPYFQYIPRAALSAVLIAAVMFMMDLNILMELWKRSKKDFFNWSIVVIICIYAGVEMGLLFGIITNLIFVVYCIANPIIETKLEKVNGKHYIRIIPKSDIYYTGAASLRSAITSVSLKYKYKFPILINCEQLSMNDFTLVKQLESVFKDLEANNMEIFFETINSDTGEFLHFKAIKSAFYKNI